MKKVFIFLFFCIIIFVVISKKKRQDKINLLILNNIEAIASDEHADRTKCYGTGSLDCPVTHTKVRDILGGYSLEVQY